MGRKGKDRKGLQIVIGLAAGLSLMLITALILVLEIPEILDSFPGVNSVSAQNTNQENTSREVSSSDIPESTNPKPTASLLPGQLPSSGQLLFNCDQEIERQKGYSLNAYNFGSGYTFEEAFTSYEISLDLELDFLDRSFSYYLHQTENWSYIKWGGTADETLRIVEKTTHARGTLNDDGWISGSWQYYWTQPDDPDAEPFEGGNDFYGYLDDQMEEIVICFLSSGTLSDDIRTNELTADFDALQAAGKDQLISSWYHPRACSICKVDGLRP